MYLPGGITSSLDGRNLCLCRGHPEELGWSGSLHPLRSSPSGLPVFVPLICGPNGDPSTDSLPTFVGEVSLFKKQTWWYPFFASLFWAVGESLLCRLAPLGEHEKVLN